jgi:hypothetical protein
MIILITGMAQVESLVPEWSALSAICDCMALLALTPDPATLAISQSYHAQMIVIPHFLSKTLMDTGTDNAADLCLWEIRALQDLDMATTATTPAAAVTATGPTAVSIFRDVAYFLWMAATKVIKPAALSLNMSSTTTTAWISV